MTLARSWALLAALALLLSSAAVWACDKDDKACSSDGCDSCPAAGCGSCPAGGCGSCPAAGHNSCPAGCGTKASFQIFIHPNCPCVKHKAKSDCACECEAKDCAKKGPCCDCTCECESKPCCKEKCTCKPCTKCDGGCCEACPCVQKDKKCGEGCPCKKNGTGCCADGKSEGCCCGDNCKCEGCPCNKKAQAAHSKFPVHVFGKGHKAFVGGCMVEVGQAPQHQPGAKLPPPIMPLMMLLESICNGSIPPPPVPPMPMPPGMAPTCFNVPFDPACCQPDKPCFSMEHKADGIYIYCPGVEECVCKKVSMCGPHGCFMLEDVKMKAGKDGSKVQIVAEKLCLDPRTGHIHLAIGSESDSPVMPACFRGCPGYGQ